MESNFSDQDTPKDVENGFSTLELVTVLVIIVLLAAISVPKIQDYMASYHLKQAARNIASQMQLARIRAIKDRVRTVVIFSPVAFTPAGGGTFAIFEDKDNDWVQDAGERVVLQSTSMPRQVTLTSAIFDFAGNGTDLRSFCGFGPQGLAARNGNVYVQGSGVGQGVVLRNSKNATRTIWLWASGKTEIL